MKVVILGAGEVGRTVLQTLATDETMELSVVDINDEALATARAKYAIATVRGHASSPAVLRQAGIEDCDAIIAATASDEVNLIACQVAYMLHDTPIRIARIRDLDYLDPNVYGQLFTKDTIDITAAISPELAVVEHLTDLITYQGAQYVTKFGERQLIMTCTPVVANSALLNARAEDFAAKAEGRIAVVAVVRGEKLVPDFGDQPFAHGDVVFIIGNPSDMQALSYDISGRRKPDRSIVIGGGGNIGSQLAAKLLALSPPRNIKILEASEERAGLVAAALPSSGTFDVLHGDATNEDFLRANDINDSDLYCAVSNDDLVNVVSSLAAERLDVQRTLTLVKNVSYLKPLEKAGVEILISPQQTTANTIHHLLREQTLAVFRHLPLYGLDLIEFKTNAAEGASRVVGKTPAQLQLPKGAHWACLLRGIDDDANAAEIIPALALQDVELRENDHAILISENSKARLGLERLFRVEPFNL